MLSPSNSHDLFPVLLALSLLCSEPADELVLVEGWFGSELLRVRVLGGVWTDNLLLDGRLPHKSNTVHSSICNHA